MILDPAILLHAITWSQTQRQSSLHCRVLAAKLPHPESLRLCTKKYRRQYTWHKRSLHCNSDTNSDNAPRRSEEKIETIQEHWMNSSHEHFARGHFVIGFCLHLQPFVRALSPVQSPSSIATTVSMSSVIVWVGAALPSASTHSSTSSGSLMSSHVQAQNSFSAV